MLGATGALCCIAAGTALGGWLRERRLARWRMLRALTEALGFMRLMLEQERLALPELLSQSAACAGAGLGSAEASARLMKAAEELVRNPIAGIACAYDSACAQVAAPWEQAEERQAMQQLFAQLGCGSAAMREQAVSSCLRRLRPLLEEAQQEAQRGGKLCMQLGALLGLMAGIALW